MKMLGLLRRWVKEQKGVAYIEFALCLPIFLLFIGGAVDVTRMVLLHQKVEKAVFTVGDLITRVQTVSNVCSNINNLQTTVIRDMVRPFSWEGANFQLVVTAVIGSYRGTDDQNPVEDLMEWRYNRGYPSLLGPYSGPYRDKADLPLTIRNLDTDERVIVTEMTYVYRPLLPNLSGLQTQTFRKVSYFRARHSTGAEGRNRGVLSDLGC